MSSIADTDRSGARFRRRDLLRTVAEGTAGAVGDEFLRCLVRHVAMAFDAMPENFVKENPAGAVQENRRAGIRLHQRRRSQGQNFLDDLLQRLANLFLGWQAVFSRRVEDLTEAQVHPVFRLRA